MAARTPPEAARVQLRDRVTCPHCWHVFRPQDVMWISAHPDLIGDDVAGPNEYRRFLPMRFTVGGDAIDERGCPCRELACPRCHLPVPRALLEMEQLIVPIAGGPFSGKSYLLTAMTWQLRTAMPTLFSLYFSDVDPRSNETLSNYQNALFLNQRPDRLTELPKTQTDDPRLHCLVTINGVDVRYPSPFMFTIAPSPGHPGHGERHRLARALSLYDNSGEDFLPNVGSPDPSATQHLGASHAVIFLFDPVQHPRFRQACRGKSQDPQIAGEPGAFYRQDQILLELANRIRLHCGLSQHEKYPQPLVVVLTKYDAWCCLTKQPRLESGWVVKPVAPSLSALDVNTVQRISGQMRSLLLSYAPEIVAAAEGAAQSVTYIPVSAMGTGPRTAEEGGMRYFGFRPRDIAPMWAEVPLLYILNRTAEGLVLSPHGQAGLNERSLGNAL